MEEFSEVSYQPQIDAAESESAPHARVDVHMDIDNAPHVMGITPRPPRSDISIPSMEAIGSYKPHSPVCASNVIWAVLVGWWVSLFYFLTGALFVLTVYGFKHGLYCFRMGTFIIFPFGRYAAVSQTASGPENALTKCLWAIFFPIYGVATLLGMLVSWELTYYIPMAKFLFRVLAISFKEPTKIEIVKMQNATPVQGKNPVLLAHSSGAAVYFKFTVLSFEVPYLNLCPFIFLALVLGFVETNTFLDNPMVGASIAMIGAIPCAYFIGICVDDLSHQIGLILGSILNSIFIGLVELILYYFSLRKSDLADAVRAAITGAILMNLLIIPGVGMFAAGLKWNEIILNRKSQSISGTFMMLAVVGVLFPSIFYHIHAGEVLSCSECDVGNITSLTNVNCSTCHIREISNIESDPIYHNYAAPLMWAMTAILPIIYSIGVFFSLKTHAHLFVYESHEEGESVSLNKWVAIAILLLATIGFSLMAHVMTDKIPEAIEQLHLSPRFVGLVFYTLIPNLAEYMNAIKFAVNGNIGLAMEIGNQGATLTAMVELPILVIMSFILHKVTNSVLFTLIFPVIDICAILIAVVLRNSILTEKSINYLTGLSFLFIFLLISIVYYFELSNL